MLLLTDVWSFQPSVLQTDYHNFPDDFQCFDRCGPCGWNDLVWIADSTQALVAYDWLLERGWELDTDNTDPQRLAFLDLLNATADR